MMSSQASYPSGCSSFSLPTSSYEDKVPNFGEEPSSRINDHQQDQFIHCRGVVVPPCPTIQHQQQQQQQDDGSRSWTNMIAAQSIVAAEPTIVHSSAPNNQTKQYQSNHQQSIRNKSVVDEHQIAASEEQTNQQRYNFQFQDEMSRMRERLFRLLSKVPIHVETEPVSSCSSTANADTNHLLAPSSSSKQTGKSARSSQQTKVIDREPLIIKYYKDRTLSELIEQHFGCSLIKHNYNHREPLMSGMDLVFNCSNRSSIHRPDQQQATTNYSSRSNGSFGARAKSEISQRAPKPPSHISEQVWPMAQNNHHSMSSSSPSSLSSSSVGQLKSWHHLSMDNTRIGWKSACKSSSASTKASNSNQSPRNQHKRNGSSTGPHSKGKGAKNHHHTVVEPASFLNYPQQNPESSTAAYQQSANNGTPIGVRYEPQPILVVSRFDGQPFVDNSGSSWQPSSLDSQSVSEVIQQQQQQQQEQHYADCYYQPLIQPQLLQNFDSWQNTEVESRLIEQQQLTTMTSETNEFNSPTALYLPFSATSHHQHQHQHPLGTPFYPSQPFSQPAHQLEAHDNQDHQLIQYQPHSIQPAAPEQSSCSVIFTEPAYLSNSSSTGSI